MWTFGTHQLDAVLNSLLECGCLGGCLLSPYSIHECKAVSVWSRMNQQYAQGMKMGVFVCGRGHINKMSQGMNTFVCMCVDLGVLGASTTTEGLDYFYPQTVLISQK